MPTRSVFPRQSSLYASRRQTSPARRNPRHTALAVTGEFPSVFFPVPMPADHRVTPAPT